MRHGRGKVGLDAVTGCHCPPVGSPGHAPRPCPHGKALLVPESTSCDTPVTSCLHQLFTCVFVFMLPCEEDLCHLQTGKRRPGDGEQWPGTNPPCLCLSSRVGHLQSHRSPPSLAASHPAWGGLTDQPTAGWNPEAPGSIFHPFLLQEGWRWCHECLPAAFPFLGGP